MNYKDLDFCRVAAAQLGLGKGTCQKAIEDAQELIIKAARAGAQIICLPEHWLLEYWREATNASELLSQTARAEHIFVITGANHFRELSGVRIRSTSIDSSGNIMGWQDKIHPFRTEQNTDTPGEGYRLFTTPFAKYGVTICYDNVFPEAARTLTLEGADLLFVPSRINRDGMEPWLLYLKTRALENRIPVIAPNVCDPPLYPGGSVIIDLEEKTTSITVPKIIHSSKPVDDVIFADINLSVSRKLRLNRLSERHPKAYRIFSEDPATSKQNPYN